jgi:predicted solute-binding protein
VVILKLFKFDMAETAPKQAAYNKNEKSRDIRTTNIQAAKGSPSLTQLSQTAYAQVWDPGAWTR